MPAGPRASSSASGSTRTLGKSNTSTPPAIDRFSTNVQYAFNSCIIDATGGSVCAYKLSSAFYTAQGIEGMAALRETCRDIHQLAPGVPIILDDNCGGTHGSNEAYAKYAFGYLGADAITVNPYRGQESLQPFLDCADKGTFVVCQSNEVGAGEFQDAPVRSEGTFGLVGLDGAKSLFEVVAHRVASEWNTNDNCGVVAGSAYPDEDEIRQVVGDLPVLIPELEDQGGDLGATVKAGMDSNGEGMIISSSQGIIIASQGPGFAGAARAKTIELSDEINRHRQLATA